MGLDTIGWIIVNMSACRVEGLETDTSGKAGIICATKSPDSCNLQLRL